MRTRPAGLALVLLSALTLTAAALPGLPPPPSPPEGEPEAAASSAASANWSATASPSRFSGVAPFSGTTLLTLHANGSMRVEIGPKAVPAGWTAQTSGDHIDVEGAGNASEHASFSVPEGAAAGSYTLSFYVSDESRGDNRTVTLNVSVLPPPGLVLSVRPGTVRIDPGEVARFNVTCAANRTLTADLRVGPLPSGWTAALSATSCSPGPGQPVALTLEVHTPEDARRDQVVRLFADVRGSTNDTSATGSVAFRRDHVENATRIAEILVDAARDVALGGSGPGVRIEASVSPSHHRAAPGASVHSTVFVSARENVTVDLAANASSWPTSFDPPILTIARGANGTSALRIDVPENGSGRHVLRFVASVRGTTEAHELVVVVDVATDSTDGNTTANGTRPGDAPPAPACCGAPAASRSGDASAEGALRHEEDEMSLRVEATVAIRRMP